MENDAVFSLGVPDFPNLALIELANSLWTGAIWWRLYPELESHWELLFSGDSIYNHGIVSGTNERPVGNTHHFDGFVLLHSPEDVLWQVEHRLNPYDRDTVRNYPDVG